MNDNNYVIIEQDEGYIVDYITCSGVTVFFIDYSEAKENPSYVEYKLDELDNLKSILDPNEWSRINKILNTYNKG